MDKMEKERERERMEKMDKFDKVIKKDKSMDKVDWSHRLDFPTSPTRRSNFRRYTEKFWALLELFSEEHT